MNKARRQEEDDLGFNAVEGMPNDEDLEPNMQQPQNADPQQEVSEEEEEELVYETDEDVTIEEDENSFLTSENIEEEGQQSERFF